MTIGFWCVLIAALLPLGSALVAKMSGGDFKPTDNHNPREFLDSLTGSRKRAHWAQQNGYEAFPPFAAAVIIAHIAHAPQLWIDGFAVAFVVLRVLYAVFYITDKASARSAAWGTGLACVIGLFVVSALA
ncbi:MAG: hypothetical protein JWM78_3881 [Verrucomicrobiaceae bacterium]|nr:hypothetical protein [Verrucomicrobiaceae bacterium]